jgi:hypothetical protein
VTLIRLELWECNRTGIMGLNYSCDCNGTETFLRDLMGLLFSCVNVMVLEFFV